ncbi:MAG: sigma-70 family RNA polymerase sigma factor [Tannerella sp.]|jgi:RNA polymerase sigma-70 factor (ECF subfamily)|nr:sigma-70 family RNA polymerase sigma factor [Tannerella sp.]
MPYTVEKHKLIPEALLQSVSNGDHGAFRAFYEIVYPIVYQFVRCFLSVGEDCREVVSEVFYIIWKQRETLMTLNNIKAWMFIICRNEVFHFLKQKKKYNYVSIDDLPVELQIDTTDAWLVDDEMLAVYRNVINELPERCKLIFLMAKEEGMKYREIAETLSITEGTVAQQMNNAMRKITEIVRRHYAESKYKM